MGKKEGDEVSITIPGKSHDITYKVIIHHVEEQILPDIDDALAKIINEEVSNLDELKQIIRKDIQRSLDKDHSEAIHKEIINYFS